MYMVDKEYRAGTWVYEGRTAGEFKIWRQNASDQKDYSGISAGRLGWRKAAQMVKLQAAAWNFELRALCSLFVVGKTPLSMTARVGYPVTQ